jgi:hypothetical protein
MLVTKPLKSKISDFPNSNMCFCSQLYGKWFRLMKYTKLKLLTNKFKFEFCISGWNYE